MSQPFLLHINTALNEAYVALSKGKEMIGSLENSNPFDHAAFAQPAIKALCEQHAVAFKEIAAVSVVNGPGSYTGLRVGLAAAKGICYALNIPLICLHTLDWMALNASGMDVNLICPMIDARRMEVYTAVYDTSFKYIIEPTAMVLDKSSFQELLLHHRMVFLGNGAVKWKAFMETEEMAIIEKAGKPSDQAMMALDKWVLKKFDELAYVEPFYVKEFYSPAFIMKKQ
jgi:tRNA threonylcarbamoyladenosine biosynthesis protein TsaB